MDKSIPNPVFRFGTFARLAGRIALAAFAALAVFALGAVALMVFFLAVLIAGSVFAGVGLYRAVALRRARSRRPRKGPGHGGDDGPVVLDAKPGPHGWSVDPAR